MELFHERKIQCTEKYRKDEPVNREYKTCGGIKGIIRNQKSSNRHYLAAPVLAQEMMNKGLVFSSFHLSKQQQLNTLYMHQQGMRILKLLDVLKSHKLGLENKQYHHIKNFVTGKVFP